MRFTLLICLVGLMPIGAAAASSGQADSSFPATCDPQELRETIHNGLDVNLTPNCAQQLCGRSGG